MFRVAVILFGISALIGFTKWREGSLALEGQILVLMAGIPSALLVAAVLFRWATRRDAIKDTLAGGTSDFNQSSPDHLEWNDWSLWMTHTGRIDRLARTIQVQDRWFLGLIPIRTVTKSTEEFRHLNIDDEVVTTTNDGRETDSHRVLTLQLKNGSGEVVTLLNLAMGLQDDKKERFMRELKDLVQYSMKA